MVFRRRRRKFAAAGDLVEVNLDVDERDYLRALLPQLRSMLTAGVGGADGELHEGLRRLFPTAHPGDVDAEEEYRSMMRDDLLEGRLRALDEVESTLDATHLEPDLADRWMTVINDVRLVLGTLLDVGEDDRPTLDPEDPDAASRFAYDYLSLLLSELLSARGVD